MIPCLPPSSWDTTAQLANGVGYSWAVGLFVSGLLYLILCRSLDVNAERAAIAASDRELAAIDTAAEVTSESG